MIKCDPSGKLAFVITKVVIDPQAGEISAGRLFSGTMAKGSDVYLNRQKQHTKIQQVFIYNGAKREIVDNVPAGNIPQQIREAPLTLSPPHLLSRQSTATSISYSPIFSNLTCGISRPSLSHVSFKALRKASGFSNAT